METDLLGLKDKMQGFIKNYVNYIKYLENKVRKLEGEKTS